MRVRAGIILAVLLFCGSIRAIEPFLISVLPETPLVKNRAHWTPLQIMLCPHVSYCFLFGRNKVVCGLNLGFWTFQGTVSGVTLSLLSNDWYVRGLALSLASWSRNKTGVSVSLVQMSENNRGVMIGLCNLPSPVTGRNNRGIQLGIVNIWNTDYCPPLKAERPELHLNAYQKNTRAIRFYEREGFQIQSEGLDEATGEKDYAMVWQREPGTPDMRLLE